MTIVYPTQLAVVVPAHLAGDDTHKWLRRLLLANGVLDPVIIAIYVFPALLPIGALWLVTLPGSMLLLMRFFGGVSTANAR